MSVTTLLFSGVATLVGTALALLGWIEIDAGRGGYGYGPVPMIFQPTEWGLVAVGAALVVAASAISGAGLATLGVFA